MNEILKRTLTRVEKSECVNMCYQCACFISC